MKFLRYSQDMCQACRTGSDIRSFHFRRALELLLFFFLSSTCTVLHFCLPDSPCLKLEECWNLATLESSSANWILNFDFRRNLFFFYTFIILSIKMLSNYIDWFKFFWNIFQLDTLMIGVYYSRYLCRKCIYYSVLQHL